MTAAAYSSRSNQDLLRRRGDRRSWLVPMMLAFGDIAVLQSALLMGALLRLGMGIWFPIGIDVSLYAQVHALVLFFPVGYALAGLYPGYGMTAVERLRARVSATGIMFALVFLIDHLAHDDQWSRGSLLIAASLSLVCIPLWDGLCRHLLIVRQLWGVPVVVIGPLERRAAVLAAMADNPTIGCRCIHQADINELDREALPDVELAIIVAPQGDPLPSIIDELPYGRLVIVPSIADVQCLWVSARDLGTYLGLEMRRNLSQRANRMIKRIVDIALSALLLVTFFPLVAVAAIAIKIVSPDGPVLFRQRRYGRGGRPFEMIKLRTMVGDADARLKALLAESEQAREEWNRHMKLREDPRTLPRIGAFLRRFSIDELPQLWHALHGDMSLVGPRPLPAYHRDTITEDAGALRDQVRPGLTGLSQISGRSTQSADEQQRLDCYYVRNWSIWLDVHILARTVHEVIVGRGAW